MAPEWTQIVDRSLKRQTSNLSVKTNESLERLKKLDIYALGIILADLVCNPGTAMEQIRIDDCVKQKTPQLPKGYKLEGLKEGEILLKLVSQESNERPTIEALKHDLLQQWKSELQGYFHLI